jgi:DNA polymerase-3 subunit alpha
MEKENALSQRLDEYKEIWKSEVKLNLADPESADPKEEYTLIGIIKNLKPIHTKKGNDMAYASLADYRGEIGVTIFPKPWGEIKGRLEEGSVCALNGKVKQDSFNKKPAFYVDSLVNIEKLKTKSGKKPPQDESLSDWKGAETRKTESQEFHIRLQKSAAEDEKTLYSLRTVLVENPGPTTVYIHVPAALENNPQGETVIRAASRILTTTAGAELQRWPEIAKVWEQ